MSDDFEISVDDHGLSEALIELSKTVPNDSYQFVSREGLHFRKNVAEGFQDAVDTDLAHKKSLGATKNYKQEVRFEQGGVVADISATSPHFHLLERGHELISPKSGQNLGFVPGYHVMDTERKKFEDTYQQDAETFVKKELKKGNLT